ncbi:MAG: right-handed parallel beta-helix repeat-containing protein, partial [Armatimonadetes bacterium]|nr:right-handed parallel beta-helix repeat-containing protein [Armatimonadota bacterium]
MSLARVILIICLATVFLTTAGQCRNAPLRPDPVAQALWLPDGSDVTLDCVFVNMVAEQYAFVRDMWSGGQVLPVYINAAVLTGWSVEITGQMDTVNGTRILMASRVRLFVNPDGKPSPPLPAAILCNTISAQLVDISAFDNSVSTQRQSATVTSLQLNSIPPPPSSAPSSISSRILTAAAGSIAAVKIDGGDVELYGKVVTAVFPGSNTFYIQETGKPSGIMVISQVYTPVEPGNLVDIKGTLIASDLYLAECYIDAANVKCVGSADIPKPLGLNNKAAAGGEFGEQQALHITENIIGSGLNAVGTRVRLWGKVTAVEYGSFCWIDDGSGLKSTFGVERTGVRVRFDDGCTLATGDYASGITGILGAEMSSGDPAYFPVPVMRVPRDSASFIIYVDASNGDDENDGQSWETAVATVTQALTMSPFEIWVAQGTYQERITLTDGVALYGGFAGDETSRAQRNWAIHETILDGEDGGSVVTISNCTSSATRLDGFTIKNGSGTEFIKYYDRDPYIVFYGGGIYCVNSLPIIANNTIINNSAVDEYYESCGGGIYCEASTPLIWSNTIGKEFCSNVSNRGGAIYLKNCSAQSAIAANNICYNANNSVYCYFSPAQICGNTIAYSEAAGIYVEYGAGKVIVNDNIVTDNGDGIKLYYISAEVKHNIVERNGLGISNSGVFGESTISDNLIVDNIIGIICSDLSCTIQDNHITDNYEIGISCQRANSYTILNNEVIDNGGTGIYCFHVGQMMIQGNTIHGNNYGGIYCDGGSVTVIKNKITENSTAGEGGGIWCNSADYTMPRVDIEANEFRDNDGGNHGGAVALHYVTNVSITNNLFVRNHASGEDVLYGAGAIMSMESPTTIVNNTFVENWVGTGAWGDITPAAYGGAIQVRYSTLPVSIVNNIFYDNMALTGRSVACTENGQAAVSYCDTYPSQGQDWCYYADAPTVQYPNTTITVGASTCFYVDPLFSSGNYWLSSTSLLRT